MHLVIKMNLIPFHFLLCLIALASLFGITISYTVNSDCKDRESDVDGWVIEANFLFDRALEVLEGSITAPNIKNILQACLGASATDADFTTVQSSFYYHVPNLTTCVELIIAQIDYYRAIVKNVGTRNGARLPDIDFRCTDPRRRVEGFFPTDDDKTGSKTSQRTVHFVSLTRISGRARTTRPNSHGSSIISFSSQ